MPVMSNERSLLRRLRCGEEIDWEYESARVGLPGNLYEKYSSSASTVGDVLVLGVDQQGHLFVTSGSRNVSG